MIKIFEKDEMKLREVGRHWTRAELLDQQGIFFLKDMVHLLNIDSALVKKKASQLMAGGSSPWQVMGARKVWSHWIVRMKVFAPYYRSHLEPKYGRIPSRCDANQALGMPGIYLLTDVCNKIPFSAQQLRFRARQNPRSRLEFGIWKDEDLGVYLVEMQVFGPWIHKIWASNFTDENSSLMTQALV